MNLTPAKSQKAEDRPISFILDDQSGLLQGGPVEEKLFIRPEEMSRSYPSRMTVNQTLGGAWVDSFGEGLEQTTISGTTGWRSDQRGDDGIDRLINLRRYSFLFWHTLRDAAVKRGVDPNLVKLRFVDTLNQYSRVIVPQTFEIRRSKSRPLLASYRISFIALSHKSAGGLDGGGGSEVGGGGFGLSSLFGSISKIFGAISTIKNFVDKAILGPVKGFMSLTTAVLTTVHSVISSGLGIASSLINVARGITQAGVNVFRTFAAIASIPSQVKSALMEIAGAYSNAFCVLKNALKNTPTYEDYNPLYGASNCSSTAGGRPPSIYAGTNPFNDVVPAPSTNVSVAPRAAQAMQTLASRDVVLAPLPIPAVGAALVDITAGVTVR